MAALTQTVGVDPLGEIVDLSSTGSQIRDHTILQLPKASKQSSLRSNPTQEEVQNTKKNQDFHRNPDKIKKKSDSIQITQNQPNQVSACNFAHLASLHMAQPIYSSANLNIGIDFQLISIKLKVLTSNSSPAKQN
ncbi:unnamed protein product [Prunus armeniaca]